jgi:hypothetical protein
VPTGEVARPRQRNIGVGRIRWTSFPSMLTSEPYGALSVIMTWLRFDICYLTTGALSAFVIRESACGGRDQLHDLVDIFLHALEFPARQIELSLGAGNLSVRSDGSYLFHVDVNQFPAGFSQFDPSYPCARDATNTERGTLHEGGLWCGEPSLLLGSELPHGMIHGPGATVGHGHRHRASGD